MNVANIEDEEAKFRREAHRYLVESGERDRLVQILNDKLKSCDWHHKVSVCCRELLTECGVDNINFDTLVENITPKATEMVPNDIKREMANIIRST
ncbi:Enhancer of yellow 2 transcription factor-like protein, partial [Euroglyphus maynei]